jgi:rieske iron-sulfur protein
VDLPDITSERSLELNMNAAEDRNAAAICGLPTRRRVVALFSALGFYRAVAPAKAEPADERPTEGDQLVAIDAADPVPLEPKDIGNSLLLAWPMEPSTKLLRSGSRLNKVLLVRIDPSTLAPPTRERAADGVLAYSAICPHAGCEVTDWSAEQQILECPCHNSRYNAREAAKVIDGPTTRALAALPLKMVDGKLAVAKPFIGRLGIAPA